MKKITLIILALLFARNFSIAQANIVLEAPQSNGGTTTGRAPNGTSAHAYMRGAELVLASELTNMPVNTSITAFGFTLSAPASANCTGNFTVYLQNTNDVTYSKGATWSGIIAGMTTAYTGIMTVPNAGSSIMVTLTTPFVYTGGGLYVAYDWESTGPYAGTAATYLCEYQALNPGCMSGASASAPAPTTLGGTTFRPALLFSFVNPNTNDMQVVGIDAPGHVNATFNSPHTIVGVVKNASNGPLSNVSVSLNVTGANPFSAVQNITSIASGATASVNFAAFNPTILGANTISVYVGSDQNNSNNSATYSQSVTCNYVSQNPSSTSYTASTGVGFGTGSGLIVTPLVTPVNATLTGIRGSVSSNAASLGKTIYAVLLNAAGTILATTNTITIATLSTVQDFTFATAQNITASTTYYIGFAQPANATAYYPAGAINSSYVTGGLYYAAALTGGALFLQTANLGYLDIEGIFANNFLSASASPTAFCVGGQVDLTYTGTAVSYTWNTGASTFSISDTPSTSTSYSIVGVDSYGCINTKTIPVTVYPLPVVTALSSQSAVCYGNYVVLTALGSAVTYTFNSPTGSIIGGIDTPTVSTTYTLIGKNQYGCIDSNYVSVIVNDVVLTTSSSTAICRGDTIMLSASGADTYTWSSNENDPDITVSPTLTTNYTVNATGVGNCPASAVISVTVNPRPTLVAFSTKTLVCTNNTVALVAGGANSYTWSTNANTSSIVVSSSSPTTTIYTVAGSNTFGCVGTTTVAQKVMICVGIEDLNLDNNIEARIYPNPNNGVFTIEFVNTIDNGKIEIRNTLGQLLKQELISSNALVEIDMSNEVNGIYFIYVVAENRAVNVGKIIKQ